MYKKVLVPLDGSELSESILDHAVNIAKCCKETEVILLNVRHSLDKDIKKTLDVAVSEKLDKLYEEEAEDYLKKIAEKLKCSNVEAEVVIATGDAAEEIIKYAKGNDIDIIIMSSHGRSGVSRWMFGSVADKVIRHSKTPVLIQPAVNHKD